MLVFGHHWATYCYTQLAPIIKLFIASSRYCAQTPSRLLLVYHFNSQLVSTHCWGWVVDPVHVAKATQYGFTTVWAHNKAGSFHLSRLCEAIQMANHLARDPLMIQWGDGMTKRNNPKQAAIQRSRCVEYAGTLYSWGRTPRKVHFSSQFQI